MVRLPKDSIATDAMKVAFALFIIQVSGRESTFRTLFNTDLVLLGRQAFAPFFVSSVYFLDGSCHGFAPREAVYLNLGRIEAVCSGRYPARARTVTCLHANCPMKVSPGEPNAG